MLSLYIYTNFPHVEFSCLPSETNARQQLLDTLGFDPAAIADAASTYVEEATTNGVESLSLNDKKAASGMTKSTEEMVKKALLVGNFEAAVECCFRTGNFGDALVLASCGGPELWAKAQQRYFESQSEKRQFLSTVSAIIRNEVSLVFVLFRCVCEKRSADALSFSCFSWWNWCKTQIRRNGMKLLPFFRPTGNRKNFRACALRWAMSFPAPGTSVAPLYVTCVP